MIDVTILYTHKKSGVLVALILLLLVPVVRADPGFTLEDVRTWRWVDDTEIFSVAVGNVDGDPALEIITGGAHNDGTRNVAQLTVWDGGTLQGVKTWYWTGPTYIKSVACGDVDGDGEMEIVTGGYYYDGTRYRAQLAVWDGATLTLEDVTTWNWTSHTFISSVAVGDVDGDGSVEIVTGGDYDDGTRYNAQLAVWDGATLALEEVRTWYWMDDTRIRSVACGDVDGDGSVEIVTGGDYDDGTPLRFRAQLAVWDGSTLTLEDVTTWYWTSRTYIYSVAIENADGDGDIEIVTGGWHYDGTRDNAQLAVWDGATLALEEVKTWHWISLTRVYAVDAADVDGDLSMEIVTGGYYDDGARWVAQLCVWNGTLSLEGVKTWYWTGYTEIRSVACGDVDGDPAVEIVTGGDYSDLAREVAQLCVWGYT